MSTSLLYHAFRLSGIEYQSTSYIGDTVILNARMNDKFTKCPSCQCRKTSFKGHKNRTFWMPPIGRSRCSLNLLLHRLKCKSCGNIWWPQLPFMIGMHRYTRSFALTALDLLRFGTIRSVACYLGVGWDLIKEIHKTKLSSLYRTISLRKVKYLGIDEFSLRKGHNYMTIFTDL